MDYTIQNMGASPLSFPCAVKHHQFRLLEAGYIKNNNPYNRKLVLLFQL